VGGDQAHEVRRRTLDRRDRAPHRPREEHRPARAAPHRPPAYRRPLRPSKLDPHKPRIHALLKDDPEIPASVIRERITDDGYAGGKSILDDYVRELRPVFRSPRTYQRTVYRPGELLQFDLFEPKREIPVGHGQTRRGWVVTAELGYSRALAGALVFSKEFEDIAFGMARCLERLGALPKKLVWDPSRSRPGARSSATR
jgi:transposase